MMKLYNGEDFGEKKEAIPMLWLISSFISSCAENGIEPLIYCKEKQIVVKKSMNTETNTNNKANRKKKTKTTKATKATKATKR